MMSSAISFGNHVYFHKCAWQFIKVAHFDVGAGEKGAAEEDAWVTFAL